MSAYSSDYDEDNTSIVRTDAALIGGGESVGNSQSILQESSVQSDAFLRMAVRRQGTGASDGCTEPVKLIGECAPCCANSAQNT